MITRNSELPCVFDVDETLILKSSEAKDAEYIKASFYGVTKFVKPIKQHIEFLKACHARGYEITVWSANGVSWAKEIVEMFNLTEYVDFVATKPLFYCDDKPADKWMKQVYITESD